MIIAVVFAFFMLLVSTMNVIVSVYCTLALTGIIASAVALIQMLGWQLGTVESIAMVVLIGLSVDYVVHLAIDYVGSVYPDRRRRTDEALKHLGMSIFSGGITTMGSGLFLFLCSTLLMTKFAILISATIFFSLLFSMVFFIALLSLAGPENYMGNLMHYLFVPLFRQCKKCKEKE